MSKGNDCSSGVIPPRLNYLVTEFTGATYLFAGQASVGGLLKQWCRTDDAMRDGKTDVGTREMADWIVRAIRANGIIKC